MAANPPSRHHYIPEFYLRRWCGEDGRMVRYMQPVPGKVVPRRCSPREAGFEHDLYRSPVADPTDAQALEALFFAKLDDMAAKALDTLIVHDKGVLNRESMDVWCLFIFALLHRTPHNFKTMIQHGTRIIKETIATLGDRYLALREPRQPATFEEFVASMDEQGFRQRVFATVPSLILNTNILNFLRGMHWGVLVIQQPRPNLLLSDDPVVRTNGLKTDDGHVVLPLSPSHLMVGAYRIEKLLEIQAINAMDLVKQVNQQTVEAARVFVVATDDRQERFIANRFGAKPRPPLLLPD